MLLLLLLMHHNLLLLLLWAHHANSWLNAHAHLKFKISWIKLLYCALQYWVQYLMLLLR